jgi:hypothetical protein
MTHLFISTVSFSTTFVDISHFSFITPTVEHRACFTCFSILRVSTVGWTSWTGDQPVALLLPTQDIKNIYALNVMRTHDPSVRPGEESSCPRPRGHCDRPAEIQFRLNVAPMFRQLMSQHEGNKGNYHRCSAYVKVIYCGNNPDRVKCYTSRNIGLIILKFWYVLVVVPTSCSIVQTNLY